MHDNNNNNDTRTNAYIEVIHFKTMPADGDGITYGRIHVQIAVWADENMTDLIDVADCYSVTTMNAYLRAVMDKYSVGVAVA